MRLALVLPVLALAGGAVAWHARQDPKEGFTVTTVNERLFVIHGDGPNTVVLAGTGPGLVIDPKPARVRTELLAKLATLAPGLAVRWVIDTHLQPDLAGANAAFPDAATIAHESLDRRLQKDTKAGVTMTFDAGLTLAAGAEKVGCRHKFHGASEGDCFAYFHDAQLLVTGDLTAHRAHPVIRLEDGGDLRTWIRVLKELRKDFGAAPKLRVVPGRGPVGGIEVIDQQLEYLQDLTEAMDDAHRHGLSLDEAIAAAEPLRTKYAHYTGGPITANLRAAYQDTAR